MTNNTKRPFRRSLVLVLALVMLLGCLFTGCQTGGDSADNPAELSSASKFNTWFSPKKGKSLANLETPGTYYFKLTKNLELNGDGAISKGQTVIIDLNGFTITNKEDKQVQVFRVTEGASLTLRGGKIETTGAAVNGGLIAVEGAGSKLILEDVTLTNTDDTAIEKATINGGVIYANSPAEAAENPATVIMQGDTVINGSASGARLAGGAVSVEGSSCFYMYGGTIQNGKAGSAGNVNVDEQAGFYMHDGLITGGSSEKSNKFNGYGGNVAVRGKGRLWMFGGTISNGHAGKTGGNIYLSSYGTVAREDGLHILGGQIVGGSCVSNGGNVFATERDSTIYIYGGEILEGEAGCGGNIYLEMSGLEMWGGTLTGLQNSTVNSSGANIFCFGGRIDLYDGLIHKGWTNSSGGNIYVDDTIVNVYGGHITQGQTATTNVATGGGNLFATGESVVNLYNGLIDKGECNVNKEDVAAAGANVMLAGKAYLHMYGGEIKHGQVYGNVGRGGDVYVYGQVGGTFPVFHMYSGLIENDLLCDGTFEGELMRGMGIGAYSVNKSDVDQGKPEGLGIARVFNGKINYLGPDDSDDKRHMLYSNRSNPNTFFVFDADMEPGLTRAVVVGPCKDASHNTRVETVAPTCLTQGMEKYHCDTCGDWYKVTAEATGHTVTETVVEASGMERGYTEYSCSACDAHWYAVAAHGTVSQDAPQETTPAETTAETTAG